ncbi:MAG TPA: SigE family RNA polymerase sigma factor [Acidimicrobiales bacterium]|nr:SigE family RNA polymerase sigma factor [Acidimicrobiales bacterium]
MTELCVPGAMEVVRDVAVEDDGELAAFFSQHFKGLCQVAYLLVGNASVAEEVVMDAFASTVARWDTVRRADNPLAYVRRAVVNMSCSRVRRFVAERRAYHRVHARYAEPAWDGGVSETFRAAVDAVAALPPRQRATVVLRCFADLPEAEIAAVLGCSVGTVKSQLSKARARLAAVLLDRPEEDHHG